MTQPDTTNPAINAAVENGWALDAITPMADGSTDYAFVNPSGPGILEIAVAGDGRRADVCLRGMPFSRAAAALAALGHVGEVHW